MIASDKLNEHELVEAFDGYWNAARFQRGWATPSVSRNDVKPLLQQTAHVVNNLCKSLQLQKCSTVDLLNSASEAADSFFSQITYHPLTDPKRFINELVRAVVRGAPNHFGNLDESKISEAVSKVVGADQSSEKVMSDIGRHKQQIEQMLRNINEMLPKLREEGAMSSWRSLVQAVSLTEQRMTIIQSEQEEARESAASVPTLRLPVHGKSKRHKKKKRVDESQSAHLHGSAPSHDSAAEKDHPEAENSEPTISNLSMQPTGKVNDEHGGEEVKITTEPTNMESVSADEHVESASPEQLSAEETPVDANPSQIVEIKKVASLVEDIAPQIMGIKDQALKLDLDDLAKHPNVAYDYVSRLHRDSLQYSEDLMKSLLKLDGLVCNIQEKPMRKSVVQKIQAMLDMMDEINNDLHDIQEKLNEKRMEEKEKEAAKIKQEQETKAKEQAEEAARKQKEMELQAQALSELMRQQQAEQDLQRQREKEAEHQRLMAEKKRLDEQRRAIEQQQKMIEERQMQLERARGIEEEDLESSTSGYDEEEELMTARSQYVNLNQRRVWTNMRLEPRNEVQELQDAYVVRILAPGMNNEDFDIGMDNSHTLSVRATKAPSLHDILALREDARRLGVADVTDQHVVQLASGRFGTFRLTYNIPDDVDENRIGAKYDKEKGSLTLILKKKPVLRRPIPRPSPYYDWLW